MLSAAIADRLAGRAPGAIARAFHCAIAEAVIAAAVSLRAERVVVSGGVFQNAFLLELLAVHFGERLWFNTVVPPNDGGLSLGQAALGSVQA